MTSATESPTVAGADAPSPVMAGTAAVSLRPESPLPMIGFVRRQGLAEREGLPLEATVLVLEGTTARLVICGVDTIALTVTQSDRLRARIAEVTGTRATNVLLNWNHTHNAPPAGRELLQRSGLLETGGDPSIDAYGHLLERRVVDAARAAADTLEPAAVTWGVGHVDASVNRRERDRFGRIVHGWRVDGTVDQQVVVMQCQRPDGEPIASVVSYGCHPVAVGMEFDGYSSDYPGAARLAFRCRFGGEVIFLQGAAGNVLPRVCFVEDEGEAWRIGDRIALEAAHALADRPAWPEKLVRLGDASLIPMRLLRRRREPLPHLPIAAVERRVVFPLQPPPSQKELTALVAEYEQQLAAAVKRGAGPAERHGLGYHLKWARLMLEDLKDGPLPTSVTAPMSAMRVGDGAIVTVPGELFTELGWAIKQRSPAIPTIVAAYTNGAVGYLPTEQAYAEGGYEPAYSNRSYGTPATVAPSCARQIVENAVRMVESLFPERQRFDGTNWLELGALPELVTPPPERPPDAVENIPEVAPAPG